ncbi:MAG: cobalamin-binding protein [Firmicutes bacterium]|nr:cobalamin-binding protein [Bacillota bacterium]
MGKRKWFMVMMMVILILTLAVGCGQQEGKETPDEGENDPTNAAYPMTVTDAAGREVTLESRPGRIVSLMPSLTEISFALEAGDRVVGVTTYCDYPAEATTKDQVGDLFNLNTEKILSLEPDLVLVGKSETLQQSLSFLEDAGVAYFVVDPQTLDEIEGSIIQVAEIIDAKEIGESLVASLQVDRAALEAKVAAIPADERANVFVLIDTDALYTVGEGEFVSEMIATAGGNNLAAALGSSYFQVSEEAFFELNPEILINTWPMRDQVLAKDAWKDLAAVKNDKVFDVNGSVVTRPGPRYVQGLEELYRVFTE